MKGDVSFMSLSMCLTLKFLLPERHKLILTSFLMTLRFSSRFTIRNFTVDTKKNIVKYSGCNMSLHKPASPFLCSRNSRLSVYLTDIQVFPQTALPSISHPRGLCLGDFICSYVLQKPPAFTRKDYKVGVHSGFVCSGACLQSICIVKTVG